MLNVPENIKNILNDFVNGVQEILGESLKSIILYGSYARGDYNSESDVDIMILTDLIDEKLEEYKQKIWDYSYDLEYKYNFEISLSPLVKNIDKYNNNITFMPFYKNVNLEGVVLNG